MAITYRTSFAGGGTSLTADRTIAFTPTAGDLLLAFCTVTGNTNAAPTFTDDQSGVWDRIATGLWATSANCSALFVRQTVATAVLHTATYATGSNTAGEIVVVALQGSSTFGSAAIRQYKRVENVAAGTPAPVFDAACLTSNCTLAGLSSGDATNQTPSGWTERQDVNQGTPTCAVHLCSRDSGFTGTTVTWGGACGTTFAAYIVEIDGRANGVLAATLGALTSTATGTVQVKGTASVTLGSITTTATGAVKIQGALAKTLGALTVAGAGTVTTPGATSPVMRARGSRRGGRRGGRR